VSASLKEMAQNQELITQVCSGDTSYLPY